MKAAMGALALIAGTVFISLLAAFGSAAAADAGKKTATNVIGYQFLPLSSNGFVATGWTKSAKDSCVAARKFKLVVSYTNGKSKVVDHGLSSSDGALSGRVSQKETKNSVGGKLVLPKTEDCSKGSAAVNPAMTPARLRSKPAKSSVVIAGLGSSKSDGAFGGIVESKRGCTAGRKLKLTGGSKVLDRGTTTADGAWSLHVTETEFFTSPSLTVSVAGGNGCGGDVATFVVPLKQHPSW